MGSRAMDEERRAELQELAREVVKYRAEGDAQIEQQKAWIELGKGQTVLAIAFIPAMAAFAAFLDHPTSSHFQMPR